MSSGQSVCLVPPHFAIWIPALTVHSIRMPSAVSMRTLYIRLRLAAGLPVASTVLHVSPLLRELILEAVRAKELRIRNGLHCALRDLLLAQLRTASPMPICDGSKRFERARRNLRGTQKSSESDAACSAV